MPRPPKVPRDRRVLYLQYVNPGAIPPLIHSSKMLAERGCSVRFLGVEGLGDVNKLSLPAHPRISFKQLVRHRGLRQRADYFVFLARCLLETFRFRPRWIYAMDPLSTPVALLLTFLPGVRVVYHENDSVPLRVQDQMRYRLCLITRRLLGKRADAAVFPNDDRARIFAETTGCQNTVVVYNCPSRDDVLPSKKPDTDGLSLLLHGAISARNITPALIRALRSLPDEVTLDIIGYETMGAAGYAEELLSVARSDGTGARVRFLGSMPRAELIERVRTYDAGVVQLPIPPIEDSDRYLVGASIKVFDYLAAGLAVIVPSLPDWEEWFVEAGFGVACDPREPASIAEAAEWLLAHPKERRRMGQLGQRKVLEVWNYESQFAPVLEMMLEGPSERA